MTNLKLPEDFETYPEARKNAFLKMKELKESGRRIVGVFCTYTPWELIEAAGTKTIYGISVFLCKTVPGTDGETGCRQHRGIIACDFY